MNFEMDKQLTVIFQVLETMQGTLKCSICLDLLSYPVTTKCGHSFCGICIDRILSGSRGSGSCPLCMSVMTRRSLNENKKVINLVDAVRNIISCIKEDVGYDDSHRKKKEQMVNLGSLKLPAPDKAICETVSPIRRGTRNREQAISTVEVDNKKRTLPKNGPEKSFTNEAKVCNATQENISSGLNMNYLHSNPGSTVIVTKTCRKESNLTGTNMCTPIGKYMQATTDFHLNVPHEMQVNSVKRKVEEWLDNEMNAEVATSISDDASATSNEYNHKFIHPGKNGGVPEVLPCITDLKENALISSSQASTVIFTPGRPIIDLKSQDVIQTDFELEDKQTEPTVICIASENFKDGLLDEKENRNDIDQHVNCNAKIKRGSKRTLPEKNVVLKNKKKSDTSVIEKSEASIDQSLMKCTPTLVGLQENLDVHFKTKSKCDSEAHLQIKKNNSCNNFSEMHPNSKGHNIRFASEIKCKLLENSTKPSRLTVKKRTRQSPGWSHIENVKKDLRSKHTVLNIKGGEGKQVSDTSRADTLSVITDLSQESVIVIEDQSQDQHILGKGQEAGRFKRFKNAFSFKGKFTEISKSENKSGSHFKRRTKECFPRNRKKNIDSVLEPITITAANTNNLDFTDENKVKNKENISDLDECSLSKSTNDYLVNQENLNLQNIVNSCEKDHRSSDIEINKINSFSHHKQSTLNLTKVSTNSRLTRSKCKEIDEVQMENILLKHNDVKMTSFGASSKMEQICDSDMSNLVNGNLKQNNNPEPIQNNECHSSIKVYGNGLSESPNSVNEQNQFFDEVSLSNCRKSFNLLLEQSKEVSKMESNDVLNRDQTEINKHQMKASEHSRPAISSIFNNKEKFSQIASRRSVPFMKKGKFEKSITSLCQHSVPCDVFQALKNFSNLMMNYSFERQSCFRMGSASGVSVCKPMPVKTKNFLCEDKKLSNSKLQSTYQEDIDNLAGISENVDNFKKKKLYQNLLMCRDDDKDCLTVQVANCCIIPAKSSLSSRKLNFSPLSNPISPLQSSLDNNNHDNKHCEDMNYLQSQFSLSILPEVANTSPSNINKTILSENAKKPNIYDAIKETQSSKIKKILIADTHDAEYSDCESEDLVLKKDTNLDVISSGSSIPCSSLSTLTNMKRFRRIATLESSEDSSSDEDLSNLKRTTKRVRRANIESPTPISQNSSKCLANSEEIRDFQRYDENIWHCYRNNNQSHKRKKVSLLPKEPSSLKNYPSFGDVCPEKECTYLQSSKEKKTDSENEDIPHMSDEDEYIPGTEEALRKEDDSVIKKLSDDKFSETINLISQVSPISTVTSSNLELPQSTKILFKKCEKSLAKAEKIIASNQKITKTDSLPIKSAKEKDLLKDNSMDHNIGDVELNCAITFSETSSNNSLIIPSQQKEKAKRSSQKASAEIVETNELTDFHKESSKSISCELPEKNLKELLLRDKDKFSRDSDQDSEELFKSISASILEQDAKEKLIDCRDLVTLPRVLKDCMTIVCTGLSNAEIDKVNSFVEIVCQPGTKISNIWTKDTTHIIAKTDADGVTDRTLKYLYGVAYGIWIVSFSWVVDSLNSSILLPEEDYEVLDCTGCPGPNRGRKRSSPIFKNCQFCLVSPFANITEDQFIELITICGGEVVSDAYNFNEHKNDLKLVAIDSDSVIDFQILEDIRRCGKVLIAHDWIIECIGMCALVALSSYIFGEPSEREIKASGIKGNLLSETQEIL